MCVNSMRPSTRAGIARDWTRSPQTCLAPGVLFFRANAVREETVTKIPYITDMLLDSRVHQEKKRSLQSGSRQRDGQAASDSLTHESIESSHAVDTSHANLGDDSAYEHSDDAHRQLPRCPNCGWRNVRLSHSNGVMDKVFKFFAVVPFRCRSCGLRFHRRFIARAVGGGE